MGIEVTVGVSKMSAFLTLPPLLPNRLPQEDRLQLDENRLIGAPPVPFSARPVIHDILKGESPPYEGKEENLPVSEENRGSPLLHSPINRVFKEEKKEESAAAVPGVATNVCFVHTVEDSVVEEGEAGRGELTVESEEER